VQSEGNLGAGRFRHSPIRVRALEFKFTLS
jgi:hypothetical protein